MNFAYTVGDDYTTIVNTMISDEGGLTPLHLT